MSLTSAWAPDFEKIARTEEKERQELFNSAMAKKKFEMKNAEEKSVRTRSGRNDFNETQTQILEDSREDLAAFFGPLDRYNKEVETRYAARREWLAGMKKNGYKDFTEHQEAILEKNYSDHYKKMMLIKKEVQTRAKLLMNNRTAIKENLIIYQPEKEEKERYQKRKQEIIRKHSGLTKPENSVRIIKPGKNCCSLKPRKIAKIIKPEKTCCSLKPSCVKQSKKLKKIEAPKDNKQCQVEKMKENDNFSESRKRIEKHKEGLLHLRKMKIKKLKKEYKKRQKKANEIEEKVTQDLYRYKNWKTDENKIYINKKNTIVQLKKQWHNIGTKAAEKRIEVEHRDEIKRLSFLICKAEIKINQTKKIKKHSRKQFKKGVKKINHKIRKIFKDIIGSEKIRLVNMFNQKPTENILPIGNIKMPTFGTDCDKDGALNNFDKDDDCDNDGALNNFGNDDDDVDENPMSIINQPAAPECDKDGALNYL